MTLLGVAAATATATVVTATAPAPVVKMSSQREVTLTAATAYQDLQNTINTLLPQLVDQYALNPGSVTIPGLDLPALLQNIPAQLLPQVLNLLSPSSINLSSLLGLAGLSSDLTGGLTIALNTLLTGALGPNLTSALSDALTTLLAIPLAIAGVSPSEVTSAISGVAASLVSGVTSTLNLGNLLGTVLQAAHLTDANGNLTLGNLLSLVGGDVSNIIGSTGLSITTAGPLFTALRFLGIDAGWVPGTETAIANAVNNTNYLKLGTSTLVDAVAGAVGSVGSLTSLAGDIATGLAGALANALPNALTAALNALPGGGLLKGVINSFGLGTLVSSVVGTITGGASSLLSGVTNGVTGAVTNVIKDALNLIPKVDLLDIRVPIVVATGTGAFSAGAAYDDVLSQLSQQPGGANYTGATTLLGSLTVLPEILVNNAGRANGGILARFSDLLTQFGVDSAVTQETHAVSSSGAGIASIPLLNTGLTLGGANLLPVKIDATAEYLPMSDFASWMNPFTVTNNVAALLPTYLLRGLDMAGASTQLASQMASIVGSLGTGPLAANIYLTVGANSLPLLEPLYLAGDALNSFIGAHTGDWATKLANALKPALTSLVNLGYNDVVRHDDGTYTRSLNQAGSTASTTSASFFSIPNLNWQQVATDIFGSLQTGFNNEFGNGTPTATPPNVITAVMSLLSGISMGATPTSTAAKPSTVGPQALTRTATTPVSVAAAPVQPAAASDQQDAPTLKVVQDVKAADPATPEVPAAPADVKAPEVAKETVDPVKSTTDTKTTKDSDKAKKAPKGKVLSKPKKVAAKDDSAAKPAAADHQADHAA